ncbi:MAG: hypothetical protein QCH99_08565 [Candidatus Bathyarchaeota archaeon]|nr:hypothetical protein [Candidatus Bathyarchaeum tardum]WGM89926.1 MAG: hypothetical protein NUK63_02055 [Candidatus Bathyarchaeum tardum]
MSTKTWKSHPLNTTIVEILERKGPVTDVELYNLIGESHGETGFGDLNKTLMRLEIHGKIYVSTSTKGKRMVELIAKKES